MAVENIKSASITKRDASPPVLNDDRLNRGVLRHSRAVCTVTSGTDTASTYRFFSIKSGAVPVSLRVSCPAVGSTVAMDFGLYDTTERGGAAVSSQLFATAVAMSGALAKTEVLRESTTITVALSEKAIWELLSLAADPNVSYDVVGVATGANNGSGAVLLEMDYTEQ